MPGARAGRVGALARSLAVAALLGGCAGDYRPVSVPTAGGVLRLALAPGWRLDAPPGRADVADGPRLYLRPAARGGGSRGPRLEGAYLVMAEATPRRGAPGPPDVSALARLERAGACAPSLVLACAEVPVGGPRIAGRPALWFQRETVDYVNKKLTLASFAEVNETGWIFLATAFPADAPAVQADARRMLAQATFVPAGTRSR